ncbi:hypothetical protein LTR37_001045 [Vermiconidia calcicola]|uniref:Uncharacterized protein n=1 Tax=Vermiconidia calcicola TaxID=1690605 RepID=A0ACC3NX13_9PEZI|nr:hypothetical protein LTR37_001045 [Vermiconidia calcicola]
MASPPLPESDMEGVTYMDSNHLDSEAVTVAHLNAEQRSKFFRSIFIKRAEPLEHINVPDECQQYPDFAYEVFASYLRYTTFTVKVWVNYDASCQKFHVDGRSEGCGKLDLEPQALSCLEDYIDSCNRSLGRIRFEIGTPFATLCNVSFRVERSKLNVGETIATRMRSTPQGDQHHDLLRFVETQCDFIEGYDCEGDMHGFQLADITQLATAFKRKPTHKEMQDKCWYPDSSIWMDITNDHEENAGWVDFEALGKGCVLMSCDGCQCKKPKKWWSWKN